MRYLRAFLPAVMLAAALFAPVSAAAQTTGNFFGPLIPAECHCQESQGAMDWGCVLAVLQNIINFGISLGVLIFVVVAAYAGILWITSPVNPRNREMGRSVLLNAVVGLVIALSAWLIVDFVMKAVYNPNAGFGGWNSILDGSGGSRCITTTSTPAGTGSGSTPGTGSGTGQSGGASDPTPGSTVECTFQQDGQSITLQGRLVSRTENSVTVSFEQNLDDGTPIGTITIPASYCRTPGGGPIGTPVGPLGYQLSSRINAGQANHAAPQLQQLLTCMARDSSTNGAIITSISDNALFSGKSWAECRAGGQSAGCNHTAGSWHYGGANGSDHSLAVDFGNNSNSPTLRRALEQAACACNSGVRILQEGGGSLGTALHISFGNQEGRGCQ